MHDATDGVFRVRLENRVPDVFRLDTLSTLGVSLQPLPGEETKLRLHDGVTHVEVNAPGGVVPRGKVLGIEAFRLPLVGGELFRFEHGSWLRLYLGGLLAARRTPPSSTHPGRCYLDLTLRTLSGARPRPRTISAVLHPDCARVRCRTRRQLVLSGDLTVRVVRTGQA